MAQHIAEMEAKITLNAAEDLVFDNLNSCLAMVFVLEDGRMIGGHVVASQAGQEDRFPGCAAENATTVFNEMHRKQADAGGTMALFATIGEDPVHGGIFGQPDLILLVGGAQTQHIDCDCTGGIDLKVGPGANWLVTVQAVRNVAYTGAAWDRRFNGMRSATASLNVP
jgi:hypothetical protein